MAAPQANSDVFACEECGRCFSRREHLQRHGRIRPSHQLRRRQNPKLIRLFVRFKGEAFRLFGLPQEICPARCLRQTSPDS